MRRTTTISLTIAIWLSLSAALRAEVVFDISAYFNGDTFATDTSDSSGVGYRGANNEKFLFDGVLPGDGVIAADGFTFELGSYTADNTVLLESSGAAGSVTFDIADQRMASFAVIHSAVGFNITSITKNGTVSVNYLDGASQQLFWDLADSDGHNIDGQSNVAASGLINRKFIDSTQLPDRNLYVQTFTGFDPAKTVASLTFDSSDVGVAPNEDEDADFGVYALTAKSSPYVVLDISSKFNRDTIAIADTEPDGGGYRNNGDRFVTTTFNGGFDSPNLPPSGEVVGGGTPFELGPFDDPDTEQLNTWVLGLNQADDVLDIADAKARTVSVLFTGVGFNESNNPNGQFTIFYTDSTSDVFTWDLADSLFATNLSGLAGEALSGMEVWNSVSEEFFFITDSRYFFYQDFAVDTSKTIDRIAFNTLGVDETDPDLDAEFGVYSITLTVPEPTSLLTLAPVALLLFRRRH